MAKKAKKAKFLTAKQLGILPEERKALIDFVKAPVLGRTIAVNGHAHYYDQSSAADTMVAERNECGTAGCVAGFVFAHARHVQGKRLLRGRATAAQYLQHAANVDEGGLLTRLYSQGRNYKLETTRKIVAELLKKGKFFWPNSDGVDPRASFEDEASVAGF